MKIKTNCTYCGNVVIKTPSTFYKANYCSVECAKKHREKQPQFCLKCGKRFKRYSRNPTKFCSRTCSNLGRAGIKYTKRSRNNDSRRNLEKLQNTFNCRHCMIEGCKYDKTFD